MTTLFGVAALVLLLTTIPFIYRTIVGPTLFDRVQALNAMGTLVTILIVVTGLVYGRMEMFVDIALAMFLLNVFTTLLIARYVDDETDAG